MEDISCTGDYIEGDRFGARREDDDRELGIHGEGGNRWSVDEERDPNLRPLPIYCAQGFRLGLGRQYPFLYRI